MPSKKPKGKKVKKSQCKCTCKCKGFTLIELLVVIAIIGLLSTLAVVSLSAARTRARDAKRLADARNIQSALELYASEKGTYPIGGDVTLNGGCVDRVNGVKAVGEVANCTDVLMKVPIAQTTLINDKYIYKASPSGTKYVMSFYIEASKTWSCATPAEVQSSLTSEDECATPTD